MDGGRFFEMTACPAGCLPWMVLGQLGVGVSVYRYAETPEELRIIYRNESQQRATGIDHADIPASGVPLQFSADMLEMLRRDLPRMPQLRTQCLECVVPREEGQRVTVRLVASYFEHGGIPYLVVQTLDTLSGGARKRCESAAAALQQMVALGRDVLAPDEKGAGEAAPYVLGTAPAAEGFDTSDMEHVTLRRQLTRREGDVCDGIVRGLSNGEIAQQLGVTPESVHKYRTRIRGKLRVASRERRLRDALIDAGWIAR